MRAFMSRTGERDLRRWPNTHEAQLEALRIRDEAEPRGRSNWYAHALSGDERFALRTALENILPELDRLTHLS